MDKKKDKELIKNFNFQNYMNENEGKGMFEVVIIYLLFLDRPIIYKIMVNSSLKYISHGLATGREVFYSTLFLQKLTVMLLLTSLLNYYLYKEEVKKEPTMMCFLCALVFTSFLSFRVFILSLIKFQLMGLAAH